MILLLLIIFLWVVVGIIIVAIACRWYELDENDGDQLLENDGDQLLGWVLLWPITLLAIIIMTFMFKIPELIKFLANWGKND